MAPARSRACAWASAVVCVLLCTAACAQQAEPRAKGAPKPLDDDVNLAHSGCAAVLATLSTLLRNPPAELARRRVQVPGYEQPQPYTQTEGFMDDSMRALCNSMALAQFRIVEGLLGDRQWQEDPVPDYNTKPRRVPERLGKLCERMVRRHRRKMVAAVRAGDMTTAEACAPIVGSALPAGPLGMAAAAVESLRDNPAALLRLLPFAIAGVSVPFMLRPLFAGMSPVPEPRGPLQPGDEEYDAQAQPDDGSVGCVPPMAGAQIRPSGKKAGKAKRT